MSLNTCDNRMFNSDLKSKWFEPLQPQLTHLTISTADCFWGFWPKCDLRVIYFPKLKSVSLGNFSFVHEWKFNWILSHGDTLEELLLDDCLIVTALAMAETQPETTLCNFFKEVHHRWYHVLLRFRVELPYLRHFALGCGNWDGRTMFEERYEMCLGCAKVAITCSIGAF